NSGTHNKASAASPTTSTIAAAQARNLGRHFNGIEPGSYSAGPGKSLQGADLRPSNRPNAALSPLEPDCHFSGSGVCDSTAGSGSSRVVRCPVHWMISNTPSKCSTTAVQLSTQSPHLMSDRPVWLRITA